MLLDRTVTDIPFTRINCVAALIWCVSEAAGHEGSMLIRRLHITTLTPSVKCMTYQMKTMIIAKRTLQTSARCRQPTRIRQRHQQMLIVFPNVLSYEPSHSSRLLVS